MVAWNGRSQRGSGAQQNDLRGEDESVPGQEKPFHALLQEHLERGTRADRRSDDPGRRKWKHEDFAEQAGVGTRTLTNWKNGSRTPFKPEFDKMVALMFGTNPLHTDAKAAFVAAWGTADRQRGLPGRPTQTPPAPGQTRRAGHASRRAPDWVPEEPFVLRDGLGKLCVHHNQGEGPGSVVALEVTAEAGRVYLRIDATDDTPRVDATFAVTAAEIVVVRELNVTPVPRTALGTADVPHPNVTFVSSWHLKVPLASDGMPGGIVLAGDTLRQYTTHDGLPYGIRIELRCRDIDLKPTDRATLPDISEKQRAVLHRLPQRQDADPESGVLTLARAELYRPVDP